MTLTALLLAGGLSSRMGREKATLLFRAQPLWARQIALLRELEPDVIWISARTVPAWAPPKVEVILDHPPSRGPLSGITAALDRMQSSHLLALAVDLPRMSSEHLRQLADLARSGSGVIPRHHAELEPLAAIYPREAAPMAQRALASGDVSMRTFTEGLIGHRLAVEYILSPEEIALYFNLNTPDDLAV